MNENAIEINRESIEHWRDQKFGMFIHWGLYSQIGRGEWVYHIEQMDMNEYKKLQNTFTAEDFDAEKIVLAAKAAGCKYITLTTRHH
ncbi:MAG: alpha-L-fucosidase, partial [Clostridia bacterium]|nr:alpha-L-fucosidase [Clostridia bacterium]